MTSGAFHLLSKTLPKKLRTDNLWALWPEPGGQGPSPTAEQLQGPCQTFKPGQQKGRGLGIRKSWAHFAALPFTRCVTVGKSLSVSESQEGDKQSVPFHWDAVEAKSLDFGWCSMHTVPHGYCSRSAPFLTPKHPNNIVPYFSSPGFAVSSGSSAAGFCLPPVLDGSFILSWPHPPDGESSNEAPTTAWCPPVIITALPVLQGALCALRQ